MLKLYNTLTKKVESVEKKDHLNLYTCGPTVYNYAHIGNLRAFIMADLQYRTLKYDGYKPHWVMNITDVDDKTIKGTVEKFGNEATVRNLREFTTPFLYSFIDDLGEVNIVKDGDYQIYGSDGKLDFSKKINFVRVTDVIPQIQEFIIGLMQKGYAYKADDGVYFSIEKYQKDFGDYGELVGSKFLEGKKVGARVAVDEYEKDNLSDFVLWKGHDPETDGQIFWDHAELGKGRPGWHIECSVINHEAFRGEPTDIHTGGVDLIFPHHTNEIAQSQALLGKGNFVKHWFHSEHLLVDGKKMAKSAANFYTLKDLKDEGFSGSDYRALLFAANHRIQQNFTWSSLESASIDRNRLVERVRDLLPQSINPILRNHQVLVDALKEFQLKINDGLNIAAAFPYIRQAINASNKSAINEMDQVLGLDFAKIQPIIEQKIPIEGLPGKYVSSVIGTPQIVIEDLMTSARARANQNFDESDKIRKDLDNQGFEVMDTPEGPKVRKKPKS